MFSKVYRDYCDWISRNPVEASDYEAIFKWGSLFLAGGTTSSVATEFFYATSNLVTFHNDIIILKKYKLLKKGSQIKIWLSILENCEVFLELIASKYAGRRRSTVIIAIQLIKCVARLYLLKLSNGRVLPNPPLSPVERLTFKNKYIDKDTFEGTSGSTFQIRDIPRKRRLEASVIRSNKTYIAEVIFNLKPISHLSAALVFGNASWKPYVLALFMDTISLYLHGCENQRKALSSEESFVISQRYVRLLLYFLRSPLYDRHTKAVIMFVFNKLFKALPLAETILKPLYLYLMRIQRIYFYMWSS